MDVAFETVFEVETQSLKCSFHFAEETRPFEGRGFIKRETRILGALPCVWRS